MFSNFRHWYKTVCGCGEWTTARVVWRFRAEGCGADLTIPNLFLQTELHGSNSPESCKSRDFYSLLSVSERVDEWVTDLVREAENEFVWVSEWRSEWVREWRSGWMSEWVRKWVNKWVSDGFGERNREWVCVSEWVSEGVSERMNEWVREWVNKWVSE